MNAALTMLLVFGLLVAVVVLVIGIAISYYDSRKNTPTKIKPKTRSYLLLIIAFLIVFVFIKALAQNTSVPVSKLNYFNIVDNYNARTTAQKNSYSNSLKGTHVVWYGIIDDVNQDLFWTHVWIYPTNYGQDEMRFYFDVPAWDAQKFYRGQNLKVDGYISDVGMNIFQFQIKLDNVTYVETPYQIAP